ncbi:MAG: NAD(P)-dependent oxidoreductase [Dehalococcoidia bacterium]|jgi:nucleoside-diphosphate-sugar epimerase|nr:NAD(P)-dependent oxidoreductase [Dehalococcoidia bacterium]
MKVLLVGGSGMVGTFITPYLEEHHDLRVLDLAEPRHRGVEFVKGSVTDPAAIEKAVAGVDAFIWLVMQSPQGGAITDQDVKVIRENYEVNCLGLHTFLWLAQGAGLMRGVYTSSMSVHYRRRDYYRAEEEVPLDTPSAYGLSKGFGEGICRYFASWFDMNLIALRITGPRTREDYTEDRRNPIVRTNRDDGSKHLYVTDEADLARAYLAALENVQIGHGRFDPIFIAGDENETEHNLSKARRLLGWTPRSHLEVEL